MSETSLVQQEVALRGPGLSLAFAVVDEALRLVQMQRADGAPMLFADEACRVATAGPVGNPLAVVLYGPGGELICPASSFRVAEHEADGQRLWARLEHHDQPMVLLLEISVEGHVATWRGQMGWNGAEAVEADIYFPLLSRLGVAEVGGGRTIMPENGGAALGPLDAVNYRRAYMGNLASAAFLIEGDAVGLAFLDEHPADHGADPAACVQRSYVVGNDFPVAPDSSWGDRRGETRRGPDGPFVGVCHRRRFRAAPVEGTTDSNGEPYLSPFTGDVADLGPVRTYAYRGGWRDGADWLREQRRHTVMRTSPADWYRRTSFISEAMGDVLVDHGRTLHDLRPLLAARRELGSDLFLIPGFHEPELVGGRHNWLNRGDYVLAAQNLGGLDAARRGIEAVHQAGGRVIFYIEGLILWKRSRVGRHFGRQWALMNADGSCYEHYEGFWHMCPACQPWRQWLARTCARIVEQTGVDGFFIDSQCATSSKRCYNPQHEHPHPDVWNWGVCELLRQVRQAVDAVNPGTVLLVEGAADMVRPWVDGFISHSHQWTGMRFNVPLLRYLHPEIRTFESWSSEKRGGADRPIEALHLFNAVTGQRIYAHQPNAGRMQALSRLTRDYYDAYPEICTSDLSNPPPACEAPILAELFDSVPRVMTVANPTPQRWRACIGLPGREAGMLLDRVSGQRVAVEAGHATLPLEPWGYAAYELRA